MKLLPEFVNWHYLRKTSRIISFTRQVVVFYFYYFSVPLLSKTLLAPWKRQLVTDNGPGWHPEVILSNLTFNLLSRLLGLIIRVITIISAFTIIAMVISLGMTITIIWLLFPFLTWILFAREKMTNKSPWEKLINNPKTTCQQIFLQILKTPEGKFIWERLGFSLPEMKEKFKASTDVTGWNPAKWRGKASFQEMVHYLNEYWPPLKNLFQDNQIRAEDIDGVVRWYEKLQQKKLSLLTIENIFHTPGIGRDWAYGYTVNLDKYTTPLPPQNEAFPTVVGREKEIREISGILSKKEENNVILVGDPGVARHAIVAELAKRISQGYVHSALSNKRLLHLEIHNLVGEKGSILETKKKVKEIFEEALWAGNIILVIDDLDRFITAEDAKIDLTEIFSQMLNGKGLQIIGLTTPEKYHQFVETNPALLILLEKVAVNTPTIPQVIETLELAIIPVIEEEKEVFITYPALLRAVCDADLYISKTPFPEKAIDLLDEVAVYVKENLQQSVIRPEHIDNFLQEKAKIPIRQMGILEREKLLHLEKFLHLRIVNQEKAVAAVAAALRRGRLNISDRKKPLGSFLFLGPTGVGKTETAKALAEFYFGSEERIIRFDMSAYQGENGIERLIGFPNGYPGELTNKINDHPFSLLLFDEIEKADKKILNILMTLMDEGYIADSSGNKIRCNNLFVIATSNAGAEFIREELIKDNKEILKDKLIDHILRENIFSPEFINRFDDVIGFTPLSEGHLREVAKLQLEKLNKRLAAKEIRVNITPALIKRLVTISYDPVFGARAMQRAITNKVENQVARKLLEGKVGKGEKIEITIEDQ